MKVQIDSHAKTIKLDQNINLSELFTFLQKLLPKDSPIGCWKDYTLEANTVIYNWSNPVVIERWNSPIPYFPAPLFQPLFQPSIISGISTGDTNVNTIGYAVDLKQAEAASHGSTYTTGSVFNLELRKS